MAERLQKILAAAGCGSRRECEQIILDGRVTLNGDVVREMGVQADAARDAISVDGRPIGRPELRYIALYKPRGYASTRKDPHAKKTVMDLVPASLQHLYPVGRLDVPSEGLILMTNDGDLANRMTHPRYRVPKLYRVTAKGLVSSADASHLARGVDLEDGQTAPCAVAILGRDAKEGKTRLEIELSEGRNRQIRRMLEAIGFEALRLKRIAIGPVQIGQMRPGEWRDLTDEELAALGVRRALPQPSRASRPAQKRRPGGPRRAR